MSVICVVVYSTCPSIYRMIDQQHSYCLDKRSLHSSPPTEDEIEEILKLHNQERIDVQGENMQQMVR